MATQPVKWSIQIGITSEKATIPVSAGADNIDLSKLYPSAYELPLDAGGQAVGRTEMNALFSTMAENIYFQQQGGVYTYSNTINYTIGTRVLYNGEIYKCKQNNGPASTVAAPTNTTYWDRFLLLSDLSMIDVLPSGIILPYGGIVAPSGFFKCDGSEKSRTTYAKLFAAIGTSWGAGDGSTTFNLPNLNDGSFLRGVANAFVGQKFNASLPPLTTSSAGAHTHTRGTMNITGTMGGDEFPNANIISLQGAFYKVGNLQNTGVGDSSPSARIGFDASRSWTGTTSSNGSHTHTVTNSAGVDMNGNTVLPQSGGVCYIIKI